MTGYLVDTDVLSEPEKPQPHDGAIAWLREHEAALYTSAVVIGELAWGIQRLAAGRKRTELAAWLHDKVIPRFDARILRFDTRLPSNGARCKPRWSRAVAACPGATASSRRPPAATHSPSPPATSRTTSTRASTW